MHVAVDVVCALALLNASGSSRSWCCLYCRGVQYDDGNEAFRKALQSNSFELLLADDAEYKFGYGVQNVFVCVLQTLPTSLWSPCAATAFNALWWSRTFANVLSRRVLMLLCCRGHRSLAPAETDSFRAVNRFPFSGSMSTNVGLLRYGAIADPCLLSCASRPHAATSPQLYSLTLLRAIVASRAA